MTLIRVVNGYKDGFEGTYIGRPGKNKTSVLGNPYTLDNYSREDSIHNYRYWLWEKLQDEQSPQYKEIKRLALLYKKGQEIRLVCFCKPFACHGDVVKAAVEWFAGTLL
jgi:hypothetical protein